MKFKRNLALFIVGALLLFNITSTALAESNAIDYQQETVLIDTSDSTSIDAKSYSLIATDTITQADMIELTDNMILKNKMSSQEFIASDISYSAVVHTKAYTIGSGLVDLETTISGNMPISSVYGTMWMNTSSGKCTALINRPSNGWTNFFAELEQFQLQPGTLITTVGSEGVVIVNGIYSYPWETVPYNLFAVVY